jgi:hypothetical protein
VYLKYNRWFYEMQIYSLDDISVVADPRFFGFVHKKGTEIG